jgi:hypothetical protein
MSNHPHGGTAQPADSHRGLRLLALTAVVVGLLLLVAAAFVLSYSGIHAVALSAGVSSRLARLYPLIFDAMLVIACAAVLALRGAGLPSRCYAWLTMLVLLAAAAGADTLHATNSKLPHKPAAAAAAIIPWALVLIGFGLLLSMLRHARLRRAALAAAQQRALAQPSGHVKVHYGLDDLLGSKSTPGVTVIQRASGRADSAGDSALDLAIDIDPGHDDPASDEGHLAALPTTHLGPPARRQSSENGGRSASAFSPAPTVDTFDIDAVDVDAVGDAVADPAGASGRGTEGRTVPVPEARPAPDAAPAPDTRPPANATPAPRATPASDTTPAPDITPAPNTASAPDTASASDAVQVAESGPMPEPGPVPEPGPMPEPGAVPEPGPMPEPGPLPEPGPMPEPGPAPEAGSDREAAPAAEADPVAKAGPDREAAPTSEADPVAKAGPDREAAPAAEADPVPKPGSDRDATPEPTVLPHFDRKRSSPIPPEA